MMAVIKLLKKLSISCLAVIFIFFILEIFFRFFVVESNNIQFSLSAKRWIKKYHKPINSFGYRDIEHPLDTLNKKSTVFVVGDSFVDGAGIKNYKDRFSGVLQDKLGDDWIVVNIARGGWYTADEYKAVISYPHKPNFIVLSYCCNDIDGPARECGLIGRSPQEKYLDHMPGFLKFIGDKSYFLNYFIYNVYLRNKFIDKFFVKGGSHWYLNNLKEKYSNDCAWRQQERLFKNIIDYAKNSNIKLVVLIFPTLRNVYDSKEFTSKVADFMKANNVVNLDLTERLYGRNKWDLVVSSLDSHPSLKLHREIGELLNDQIKRMN